MSESKTRPDGAGIGWGLFLGWLGFVLLATPACTSRPKELIDPDHSQLRQATDIFWALEKLGYVAAKDKTPPSKHGCVPTEYLAQKDKAHFRISVFHCAPVSKAKRLIKDSRYQHVDALLLNQREGGIFRRHALIIIVRKIQGSVTEVEKLMQELGRL